MEEQKQIAISLVIELNKNFTNKNISFSNTIIWRRQCVSFHFFLPLQFHGNYEFHYLVCKVEFIERNAQRGMHPVFLTKNFFNWDICVNRGKKKHAYVIFKSISRSMALHWSCTVHCSAMIEHVVSYDKLQAKYKVQFDVHM